MNPERDRPQPRRSGPPGWSPQERAVLTGLRRPAAIQEFLDGVEYSADPFYRCPRRVVADRKAHCFDGALFAACALRRLGHPPLLLDMRAVRDDDHVVAVFREGDGIGAVAKSNFVGLRFRDPVYRSLRELVMSYFEDFYNELGEKTLRAYSGTVDLARFDPLDWQGRDEGLEEIAEALDAARHYPLLTRSQAAGLAKMDERSYRAGMLGINRAGLYKVGG